MSRARPKNWLKGFGASLQQTGRLVVGRGLGHLARIRAVGTDLRPTRRRQSMRGNLEKWTTNPDFSPSPRRSAG